MLVQGAEVAALERELAAQARRPHAVAVGSGTAALYLALEALGVGPEDHVLCPALTWPSPAHAIALLGATPVLVDVDPNTWNATPGGFAAASHTHDIKAAIAIDQFGSPCDTPGIVDVLGSIPVIVDAACAMGSVARGQPAGRRGVVATYSFHPRKVITAGEGGACVTDDPALAERMSTMRNHGQSAPGEFRAPGHNLRLTDLAAALLRPQLARLDRLVARRMAVAERYRTAFAGKLSFQQALPETDGNAQTFGVLVDDRDEWIRRLADKEVQAGRLSFALSQVGSLSGAPPCPEAERIARHGVALPLFAEMTDAQADAVIDAVLSVRRKLQ